jgi:hypothetical protein
VNVPLLCINGTKINDCNDEPLAGWTINLKDAAGNVIDTEITGADGSYSFCGLTSGTYSVEEVLQSGWQAISGPTNPIVLECSNSENNNFVNTPLLCIEGSKINARTGEGIPGWEICLTKPDGSEVCTVTDANGDYSFCELEPGVYEVCEEIRDDWTPVGETCIPVTLDCENEDNVNFENVEEIELCINGTKTNACTGEGIPGWEICLTNSAGNTVCTTTDASGDYSFCDLEPGTYTVCETPQAGWKPVEPTCIPVTLVDASAEDQNFANEPPFCISGHKFNDTTDEGLPGWTINLKDASGNQIATTTTGADGSYQFCGLFSGTYTVCEVMKKDWKAIGDTCIPVILDCADETDIDFRNKFVPPYCGGGCPWYLKSETYRAQRGVLLDVDASHGILFNDRIGATVIDPQLITIDPKYGTLTVEEDGSFVLDPAKSIPRGTTLTLNYRATDGVCDATGQGTATIRVV